MSMRKLRSISGSGHISLPKTQLEKDGLVDNGEIVEDQQVDIERVDERSYLVRFPDDDGNVPELSEADVVQKQVAMQVMDRLDDPAVKPTAD
jgi:hypothetical protein